MHGREGSVRKDQNGGHRLEVILHTRTALFNRCRARAQGMPGSLDSEFMARACVRDPGTSDRWRQVRWIDFASKVLDDDHWMGGDLEGILR